MALTAEWSIAKAKPEEAEAALAILLEVSQWLIDTGRQFWPIDSFRLEDFRSAALAGELVLGYQRSDPVASMLLQTRDDVYWPRDPAGEALYVHKIAVRRSAAGQNWLARLLGWAEMQGRRRGAGYLRLDTDRTLVPLYVRYGFRVVDDVPRRVDSLQIYRLELPLEGRV